MEQPIAHLTCGQCGGTSFWRVSSIGDVALGDASFNLLIKRASALFESPWLDAYVCQRCGTTLFRVNDLSQFARVAGDPESGVQVVSGGSVRGPYR